MHDVRLKYSTTQYCVIRIDMVKNNSVILFYVYESGREIEEYVILITFQTLTLQLFKKMRIFT